MQRLAIKYDKIRFFSIFRDLQEIHLLASKISKFLLLRQRTFSRKTTTSTAKITRTPRAVHFLRTGRTDKKPHVVSLNSPPLHQMQHTLALGCSMRTGGTPHGAGANSLRSDPMVEKNGSSTSSNVLSRKISNCSISFQSFLLYGVNVENQRICFLQKMALVAFFPRHFQHFSRSTRYTYFCTAQTLRFQQKTHYNFGGFE